MNVLDVATLESREITDGAVYLKHVGNSAEFWLNAQRAVDLWDTEQSAGTDIQRVEPLSIA